MVFLARESGPMRQSRVNMSCLDLYADPPGTVSPLREPYEGGREALTKAMRDLP